LKAKRAWLKLRLDVPTILRAEKLWGMDMTGRTDTSYRKVNNLLASMIEKATDKDGNNALMLASRAGSIRLVKLCIGAGYLPSDTNTSDHQTALHMAASSGGDRSLIGQLLITAGSDITATDSLGRTVCHIAASSGDHKLLQLLCDKGAPLEVTDKISGGRTPLHCASYFNHAECARVLLFAGANVNVKSSTGQTTPLHTAAARGAKHVVHLLCECEADINAADLGGNTPLHLSCAAGHTETVKTLLTFACQTDPKNRSGDTPGHFAASMGHEDCFHLLMVSVMSVFLSVCFSYFYILLIVVVATVAIDFFFLLF
jgi:ankyrin repeat protein